MIVADLGCCTYAQEESLHKLAERFRPTVIHGFDPKLPGDRHDLYQGVPIHLHAAAAWLYYGAVEMVLGETQHEAIASTIYEDRRRRGVVRAVRCIDLAAWVDDLALQPMVIKLDVEGAEYALLESLIAAQLTQRIERVLVEWHDAVPQGEARKDWILANIQCEVEEWT